MRYAGGKGRLWQDLVSLMPPHQVYIETHLGGGAVLRNKRPALRNVGIDIDANVIAKASRWNIPSLELHLGDAVSFLEAVPLGHEVLVYSDPPYVSSTKAHRRYYRYEYSDEDHLHLLAVLLTLDCAVMISGYSCELYEDLLSNWSRRELTNITHAGLKSEVVWANFKFSSNLHDYSFVGQGFRERERIKRKATRWVRNLERMPALERRAVMAAILKSPIVARDIDVCPSDKHDSGRSP